MAKKSGARSGTSVPHQIGARQKPTTAPVGFDNSFFKRSQNAKQQQDTRIKSRTT